MTDSFPVQSLSGHILINNANGGAFGAKIGLKSAKQVVFCILCMPMGGAILPSAPLPGYATDYLYVLLN